MIMLCILFYLLLEQKFEKVSLWEIKRKILTFLLSHTSFIYTDALIKFFLEYYDHPEKVNFCCIPLLSNAPEDNVLLSH